jgi:hypothetical protein
MALPSEKFAALQVPFWQKARRNVVLGWSPCFLRVRTGAEEVMRCLRDLLSVLTPQKDQSKNTKNSCWRQHPRATPSTTMTRSGLLEGARN